MTDVTQGPMPHNDPTARPASGSGEASPPPDDEDAAVAMAVAAMLRQRFPHRRFNIILAQSQIIIQAVPPPVATPDTPRPLASAAEPSRRAATSEAAAVSPTPRAMPEDCATCIATFLQQHSVHRADGYTPVMTFLDLFRQWCTVAGQTVFSDEEMLATLMEHWIVYQGAHEGWILDEYTVTYP